MKPFTQFITKYGMYVVLLALIAFFSYMSNNFFVTDNLLNIARQISMLGIAAVGMAFVLLVGGIDLSIGSQISLVNIVIAYLMVTCGWNPVLACTTGIAMTTTLGLLNGFITAVIKIPPLIVTLCSMTILSGVAYMICGGIPIFGFPAQFSFIGQGYVGPIPFPIIIMCIVLLTGSFILNKTYWGRYFYAVGGNEEAAYLSGINVTHIKCLVYALSGFFAGIAGMVMLSRVNSGQALSGDKFEFDALTAVVLGGVSITGGFGRISQVVVGVLILGVLSNGLILLNVSQYAQMVIKGLVLLCAVGFDCIQKNNLLQIWIMKIKNLIKHMVKPQGS